MAALPTDVFNIAKGKIAYYGGLPGTNDAIKVLALETSGIDSDATLIDYDTVTAILAGSTEQTDLARVTLASVAVTVDDSTDSVKIDADDFSWEDATGNAVSKLVVYYDPDTTASDDDNNIPLSYHAFTATPDGNTIDVTIAAGGFQTAGGAS